jgi:Coenzyme PQQ synthesis protein D (PqqD)
MSHGLERAWARSDRMVGRSVAGEFVIVPLRDQAADIDSVYNLNPVAAFIWQRLDGRTPGHTVVREIVDRFAVGEEEAAADYVHFLEQLRSIRAVVEKDAAGPG